MKEYHKPVLVNETLALLDPREGGVFVDATMGGGGHSVEIIKRIGPGGILVGIDRDREAILSAKSRLESCDGQIILIQGNFRDFISILASAGVSELDGVLFDLGVSSHQLDAARGFSFQRDEPLDMRMNPEPGTQSAVDVVNGYTEAELADVIWKYGDERYSRRIARAIVKRREREKIETTKQLADIVLSAMPGGRKWQEIHPATRTFQAIRIEVNGELEAIETALPAAIEALKIGGRIAVISFHSLEDRIVKNIFRRFSGHCECPPRMPECRCGAKEMLKVLTRKPVVPSAEEIEENPRSRSSKLRCAERIK